MLRAVNKDYEYSRDVVVYTPEEAEVVIEGHEVSPEKVNDCFKYTYTADAAETRVIEVTVNGKVYHRYIVPEKDDE